MTAPPRSQVPEKALLFHAGVPGSNGARGIEHKTEVAEGRYLRAGRGKRSEREFGGHVANENVLCEGASAQAAQCCVEAAAAGLVSGRDLGGSIVRPRVKVYTQLDLRPMGKHSLNHL